jgi:predicted MFS family arabinose efflux permease
LPRWAPRIWHRSSPSLALVPLFLSRIALGFGESMIGTGAIAWGIARTQPALTARVISWNGMATYGAIAAGAPLGHGCSASGASGPLAWPSRSPALPDLPCLAAADHAQHRQPAHAVPPCAAPGHALRDRAGAGGHRLRGDLGFHRARLRARGGPAPLALSAFGLSFVAARLLFVRQIERLGGLRVALIFLGIEIVGLLLVWQAPVASIAALGAGATGFGFALIFPALGMIVVDLVPPQTAARPSGPIRCSPMLPCARPARRRAIWWEHRAIRRRSCSAQCPRWPGR